MNYYSRHVIDYLQLRRAFGHKMRHTGYYLRAFVSYLETTGAQTITVENTLAWAHSSEHPVVRAQRVTAVRGYARYLSTIDPRTEVPPVGLLPHPKHRRLPFIYSPGDIAALIAEVQKTLLAPLQTATYETLIGLLVATGMRIGEVLRLERGDVNLAEGFLVVRASKFGKSREVPLHPTTVTALARYARKRDTHRLRHNSDTFFVYDSGKPMQYLRVLTVFQDLLRSSGVGAEGQMTPHIHDLRHTFAVRTVANWYRNGENVEACLPRLSTYLGHLDPCGTYWYLSAAPELLSLAAKRLESEEVYWL